jgi:beta-N-acetylhexosaminidase
MNLSHKPYNLSEKEIDYVEKTVSKMTLDEKVGQLFFMIGPDENQVDLTEFIQKYQPGGMMYRPGKANDIKRQIQHIQTISKVPLFFSANLESGGNGIIEEGTWVGTPMEMAATDDTESAYQLGKIASQEAAQVGCNMSFSPIVDIDFNFRNPIMNTRTFGSQLNRVKGMSATQIEGLKENHVIPVIKHFPGDGVDERDQHLLASYNSLSAEEWMDTYGSVYQELIEQGIPSVMIGHIYQPAWERKLSPEISDKELRPASASSLLVNGLLRDVLKFQGLAITDATAMVGYNVIAPRKEILIETLNAGIDMILFNKNIEEDYRIVKQAIKEGTLSLTRLDESVTRIIATKVAQKIVTITGELGQVLGETIRLNTEEHQKISQEIAKKAVTLVKDCDHLLPISSKKTPRIRLVVLGDNDEGGFKEGGKVTELFKKGLEEYGFEVHLYQMDFHEIFEEGVEDLNKKFDLAFYVANVETASNQTTTRLNWIQLMAANAPWFVKSIPTVFVSTANPYHLFDVPYISTFINAYTGNSASVAAVLRKMVGKEAFEGVSPVDPFCGDLIAKRL